MLKTIGIVREKSGMFRRSRRTPTEEVTLLATALAELGATEGDEKAIARLREEIAKRIVRAKAFVYGDESNREELHGSPRSEAERVRDIEELGVALMASEVMPAMLMHMKSVDFETRKSTANLFVYLLRHDTGGFASEYMTRHAALIAQLVDGYSSSDSALPCGEMLRECIKIPALHEELLVGPDGGLSQPLRVLFEEHVHNPSFEVAADAFETIAACLTTNKGLVFRVFNPKDDRASFQHYTEVMDMYSRLLSSDNYVLKRQSLKLLSEFLLDRDNFHIMMVYISDITHLKAIMGMLRHKQANIQFEAFHVFKVFVANPEKPANIVEVLAANKGKLIAFLKTFLLDKDDEQFGEEKAMLIETLAALPDVDACGNPVGGAEGAGAGAPPPASADR